MAYTIGGIVSQAFTLEDFLFTYYISGTVSDATDAGKAVTLDITAANTMKLTGDNDPVMGRLEKYEDRTVLAIKVGTVARRFKCKLPASIGHGIVLGNAVSGSAVAGLVKAATVQTEPKPNRVIEVGTDFVVVEHF